MEPVLSADKAGDRGGVADTALLPAPAPAPAPAPPAPPAPLRPPTETAVPPEPLAAIPPTAAEVVAGVGLENAFATLPASFATTWHTRKTSTCTHIGHA